MIGIINNNESFDGFIRNIAFDLGFKSNPFRDISISEASEYEFLIILQPSSIIAGYYSDRPSTIKMLKIIEGKDVLIVSANPHRTGELLDVEHRSRQVCVIDTLCDKSDEVSEILLRMREAIL
jgi:hypothetical protein